MKKIGTQNEMFRQQNVDNLLLFRAAKRKKKKGITRWDKRAGE